MAFQVIVSRLTGSDDHIVEVRHPDSHYIVFRVSADPTVGQFTSYDVSSQYADWGHDWIEDRTRAESAFRRRQLARS